MISIIVAFPKLDDAKSIRNLLMRNGFHVPNVANNGAAVVHMANELDGGIVVCGYKFQDMMYHELNEYLPEGFQMLLVASKAVLGGCQDEEITSLSMPIKAHELLETLAMLVEEKERQNTKRRRMPRQRSEEEQRILDEAKAALIQRRNLTEEEAHRYIQKNSMDVGRSMVETAQMLLSMI